MARRVYFHIGLPKTGTTFLQTAMWHNRSQLRAQGFLYPGSRSGWTTTTPPRWCGARRRRGWAATPTPGTGSSPSWRPGTGTGLISHEFFSMATTARPGRGRPRLAPAEVHVVVTARDYVRQFPAVWQEALKMNSDALVRRVHEAGARRSSSPAPGAGAPRTSRPCWSRWAEAVPADRIHVITVPPPGAPRPAAVAALVRGARASTTPAFDMRPRLRQRVAGRRPGRPAAPGQAPLSGP